MTERQWFGVLLNWMFRWHLFLRGNCNSGTLIHFVMNGWMSTQAVKSPSGSMCACACVCNTVRLFHLFGKNISPLQHWHRRCTVARTRRDSRWPNADWNAFWTGGKNETKMEWTLCCWILVKDASQVYDRVINLVKLQTEKPIQQNHRLLTESGHRKIFFFFAVLKSCTYNIH